MCSSAPLTGILHEPRQPSLRQEAGAVTPPPLEFPAPAADDLLGDDWFGDGSVFDTGEDLATALAARGGGRVRAPRPRRSRGRQRVRPRRPSRVTSSRSRPCPVRAAASPPDGP